MKIKQLILKFLFLCNEKDLNNNVHISVLPDIFFVFNIKFVIQSDLSKMATQKICTKCKRLFKQTKINPLIYSIILVSVQ